MKSIRLPGASCHNRSRALVLGLGALVYIAQSAGVLWGATYSITDLGTLGGTGSSAFGLNDAGTVVGDSLPTGNLPEQAFRYREGAMTSLGTLPGGASSRAYGINNTEVIVGHAHFPELGMVYRAFTYRNGIMDGLGTLGGSSSSAYAVNHPGWIVGSAEIESGSTRAFLHREGVMTNLGTLGGDFSSAYGINDGGIVVGEAATTAGTNRAFRFDGTMLDLGTLGGNASAAYGVNAAGLIVGSASTAEGPRHAFRYDGTMHDLGTLGGPSSGANSVNAAGVIVGSSTLASGTDSHAFVHDGSLRDLNQLIPPDSGWSLRFAAAINDRGQIVGNGEFNGELRGFLLTPIPTVTYLVRPDGIIEVASDGTLFEAVALVGPYTDLGVQTVTINPATANGDRFYKAIAE